MNSSWVGTDISRAKSVMKKTAPLSTQIRMRSLSESLNFSEVACASSRMRASSVSLSISTLSRSSP